MRFEILNLEHPARGRSINGKGVKPMTSRTLSSFTWVLIALAATAGLTLGQATQGTLKICRDVPVPEGYVIVALVASPVCQNGAYVIKKETAGNPKRESAAQPPLQGNMRQG